MFKKCCTVVIILVVVSSLAFAGNIKEHRMNKTAAVDVGSWEQAVAGAAGQTGVAAPEFAEEVGRTWYDYATNNQMGRMLAYSTNGIHFAFMKRQPDAGGPRYVTYNYWDPSLGIFFGDVSVTEAVSTGWGRVLNGQNDEALICMHGGGIWLWQDASEGGYSFTNVLNPSAGGVFPGIALMGDKMVFIAQLANANWTGGDWDR